MIDLKRSYLVVNCHPTSLVDYKTTLYFHRKGLPLEQYLVTSHKKSVVVSRNLNAEYLIRHMLDRFEWIIFMDQDNYPTQATDAFLEDVDYDVVGCSYETPRPESWSLPETFHMGCVRVRTSILKELSLPWFKFEHNEQHTMVTKCECGFFREKLQAAGATITRRGYCGHYGDHSWHGT